MASLRTLVLSQLAQIRDVPVVNASVFILVISGCGATGFVTSPDSGVDAGVAAPLRVLFVGNSYTYVNDLPSVVHALGDATPGASVDVDSVTVGGATLESLWDTTFAPSRIASGHYDVVVIQGNSLDAFGTGEFFYPYAHLFADAVKASGARLVWYETWARQAGDDVYAGGVTTPAFMTRSIDHGYRYVSEQWGGAVGRCGVAWQRALAALPTVNLYASDGSHPSPAGTLLAACTLFLEITGQQAVIANPVPLGLDSQTAGALCAIAPTVQCGPQGCGCERAVQVQTTYSALQTLAPACDGSTETRGLDCNEASNAVCAATQCATTGFGVDNLQSTNEVDLVCVPGASLATSYSALAGFDAACDGTIERYGQDCTTAIDRACAATGALSGFGPTSAFGNDVKATCVQPADAQREQLAFNALGAWDGNCDGTHEPWGADCDYAIDGFCTQNGFAGGFGPTSVSGSQASFVCVSW